MESQMRLHSGPAAAGCWPRYRLSGQMPVWLAAPKPPEVHPEIGLIGIWLVIELDTPELLAHYVHEQFMNNS